MLTLPRSGGLLVETPAELPDLRDAKMLFADFETSSGDPKLDSFNPWHHCAIAGLAITVDSEQKVWYIPERSLTVDWCRDTFGPDKVWINHNLKYDAHVLANQRGVVFRGRMIDTLIAAKMVDSDRWTHSLESLSKDWLHRHKAVDLLLPYLKTPKNITITKDYGSIPEDILADYGCEDAVINRLLYHEIVRRMPEESSQLWDLEQEVTTCLFDIERTGMHLVSQKQIQVEQFKTMNRLLNEIAPKVEELAGTAFEPHVNAQCEEVLTNRLGFPVLATTEKGLPSYDKHTLTQYLAMDSPHHDLIELCLEWRSLWVYNGLFLKSYLELAIEDVLHPTYVQTIRTGRMACGKPNMQQVNKIAKRMITPHPGYKFLSTDADQIEFRLICHYIMNPYALQAYEDNPDTDYHQWVSEMVGIPRKPAKNMNFMLGYGGGKKKTVQMLQLQSDLMSEMRAGNETEAAFQAACRAKANKVYSDYHEALPELKIVSTRAAHACRRNGYITNLYNRRRHLPPKASHKAFNTLNQSTAADMVKEALVRVQDPLREIGARVVAVVHDELLIEVPVDVPDEVAWNTVRPILESPTPYKRELRVPIRWSHKIQHQTWGD